jgi:hypothetical protein
MKPTRCTLVIADARNHEPETHEHVHSWNQSQGHEVCHVTVSCAGFSIWNRKKPPLFSGYYLRNRSTLDIGVLGYIGIL